MIGRKKRKVHIHTFGCQMNQADTEIMVSLLENKGFRVVEDEDDAEIMLLNTCAVRENAVERIGHQLQHLKGRKKKDKGLVVGVVGCIPQFQKERMLLEYPDIDFLAGPDTYRNLTSLIDQALSGIRMTDFTCTHTETYAGIHPARNGTISAFVPVMRGCNNRCAFCVVPLTRGRERSLRFSDVVQEAARLEKQGYREMTLLGQNVNSYRDPLSGRDFASLLDAVSQAAPHMRIRFTTSHPKDISESLVRTIASRPNICRHIHLPVQSGSSRLLNLMKRGHTIEEYLQKIDMIRDIIPEAALSTDLITGFCSESEEDFRATIDLMNRVRFDYAYMFYYSVRPGTWASEHLEDDVPDEVKKKRLQEIIDLQNRISADIHAAEKGKVVEVLAESESKRSGSMLMGRTGTNRVVVFDRASFSPGDLVDVKIHTSTSATLTGTPVLPE
jgi:tRNA-2-methylthio-N6-dimethylallyladenosine synthase